MGADHPQTDGRFVHVVTVACTSEEHAARCVEALAAYGGPDALAFGCLSYDFGLEEGSSADTARVVERRRRREDPNAPPTEKVVPALPTSNQFLKRPFDPEKDTRRIALAEA